MVTASVSPEPRRTPCGWRREVERCEARHERRTSEPDGRLDRERQTGQLSGSRAPNVGGARGRRTAIPPETSRAVVVCRRQCHRVAMKRGAARSGSAQPSNGRYAGACDTSRCITRGKPINEVAAATRPSLREAPTSLPSDAAASGSRIAALPSTTRAWADEGGANVPGRPTTKTAAATASTKRETKLPAAALKRWAGGTSHLQVVNNYPTRRDVSENFLSPHA